MSLQSKLQDLATAIATDIKQLRIFATGSSSGDLSGLSTTDKASLIAAINEVNAKPTSGAPPDASETVKGVVELATLAEVATGNSNTLVVTPAGVRQERLALKTEILGVDASAALDTLKELQDALGGDANFATTVTTALANRVRVDTAAQGLTAPQMANARGNIGAVALADIGDPDADLVAVYTAAKA